MTQRTTRTTVEFVRPFQLPGWDEVQPPGAYDVETVEEQLDSLSTVVFHRISTTITLRGPTAATASRQMIAIDPADLAAALAKDAEHRNGNP